MQRSEKLALQTALCRPRGNLERGKRHAQTEYFPVFTRPRPRPVVHVCRRLNGSRKLLRRPVESVWIEQPFEEQRLPQMNYRYARPVEHLLGDERVATGVAGGVAVSGLGIAPTTSWACRRELQSGELVQMLSDWKSTELPVNAYFPMGRPTRSAARAFVDFIAAELRNDPSLTPKST